MGLSKPDINKIPSPKRVDVLRVGIIPVLEQGRENGAWDTAIEMITEGAEWWDRGAKHNVEIPKEEDE